MQDFGARYRQELVAAAHRRANPAPSRRPRRIVAGLVTALAVVLVVAGLVLVPADQAVADVEITRAEGRVTVLLTDVENSVTDVERALAKAGLAVRIAAVPVGPSKVGRFVGSVDVGPEVRELALVEEVGGAFMGFSIPEDWEGELEIMFGRRAAPGEPYAAFSDALAPGEPLAGHTVVGRRLRTVVPFLDGLTVTVWAAAPGQAEPRSLVEALRGPLAEALVESATATSPDEVFLVVVLPPASGGEEP